MKKITLLMFIFLLQVNFKAVAQTTYYVMAGGDGSDGLSEATAFTTVNNATIAATDGDTIILVGAINQSGTVSISNSISFVGQSNAVVTATGTSRMYNISTAGLSISFENITFQNANASLQGAVINLTQNSDLTITNCVFKNNTTSNNGGAILAGNSGLLSISGSLFDGNSAFRGGAISITATGRQLVITNSTFVNNTATGNDGGAMYLGGANTQSSITNTTIFNNSVFNATLNQAKGGGIRLEGTRPFTIANSLIYGNYIYDGSTTNISDMGITPATVVTLDHSITQKIEPALDDTAGDVFATSLTEADLSASNLSFNEASGYVEYNSVSVGTDSPIDFGSDGNDVGSWNSGLTLSLEDLFLNNISIYVNYDSKTLEITHNLNENLSIELFNILGSKVMEAKNISQNHSLIVNHLKTGVYVLTGKSSGKSFAKKLIIK